MPRLAQQLFDEDATLRTNRRRFTHARAEGGVQLRVRVDRTHAAPAAAADSLEDDWPAHVKLRHCRAHRGRVGARLVAAFSDGHASLLREPPSRKLVAEQLDSRRRRPDEAQPRLFAGASQVGALR